MKASSPFSAMHRQLPGLVRSHSGLLWSMIKREVVGRYKGSAMGLFWSFVNPILMLAVYTFVFSVVFQARWSTGTGSKTEFALVLFAGLILFNLFSECVTRAPLLIIGNVNYVKKVVFPVEILPLIVLGNALFHFAVSFGVWLLFYLMFFGLPPLTILLLPVLLVPFIVLVMGISWFLASLGVYVRDVAQVVGIGVMVLMYLSPIFYPISILPEGFQTAMHFSPLSFVIEQARDVMMFNKGINWPAYGLYCLVSLLVCWLGYSWFSFTKKGFADVV
ncbi:ABC transporter permease [Oceanisphaera sp. IT1-181]|uniref:ABC transporter permease n=1 Tax=Oceanisphaera sp. IT1-181 TaxID=3081199 RepID=UPI0029C9D379|nr:ABC transporter permease [Oceanisphaera sp. IT1-181]